MADTNLYLDKGLESIFDLSFNHKFKWTVRVYHCDFVCDCLSKFTQDN